MLSMTELDHQQTGLHADDAAQENLQRVAEGEPGNAVLTGQVNAVAHHAVDQAGDGGAAAGDAGNPAVGGAHGAIGVIEDGFGGAEDGGVNVAAHPQGEAPDTAGDADDTHKDQQNGNQGTHAIPPVRSFFHNTLCTPDNGGRGGVSHTPSRKIT